MIKYDVEYIDKLGDKQDFVVPSTDVRTAMKKRDLVSAVP